MYPSSICVGNRMTLSQKEPAKGGLKCAIIKSFGKKALEKINLRGEDWSNGIALRRSFSCADRETPQRVAALDVPTNI